MSETPKAVTVEHDVRGAADERRKRRAVVRDRLSHLGWCALIGTLIGVFFAVAYWWDHRPVEARKYTTPLLDFERRTGDTLFLLRGPLPKEKLHPDIVFLDIDEETLSALGKFPLPRRCYADALNRLQKAKVVGFDIFFPEASPITMDAERRDALLEEIEKLPPNSRDYEHIAAALDPFMVSDDRGLGAAAERHGRAIFSFFTPHGKHTRKILERELAKLFGTRDWALAELDKTEGNAAQFVLGRVDVRKDLQSRLSARGGLTVIDQIRVMNAVQNALLLRFGMEVERLVGERTEEFYDAQGAMDEKIANEGKWPKALVALARVHMEDRNVSEQVWLSYQRAFQNGTAGKDIVAYIENTMCADLGGEEGDRFDYQDLIGRHVSRQKLLTLKYFEFRTLEASEFMPEGNQYVPGFVSVMHDYEVFPLVLTVAHGTSHMAFVQILPDHDGVVRRFPTCAVFFTGLAQYEQRQIGRLAFSLGSAMLLDYLGASESFVAMQKEGGKNYFCVNPSQEENRPQRLRIPVDENGLLPINWAGEFSDQRLFPHYHFSDLIARDRETGEFTAKADDVMNKLEGKIVLIGLTAIGTHDRNPNPFGPREPLVSAHGNFINTVLTENYLHPMSVGANVFLIIGCSLLLALLVGWTKRSASVLAWLGLSGGYLAAAYYAFSRHNVIEWNMIYAEVSFFLTMIGVTFYRFVTEERQKRKTRGAMQMYLTPEVVDQVLNEGLKLGGETAELTVFFSDIQGFSTISEKIGDPEKLVFFINRYMDEICAPLRARRGCIDKFIGDAVVAFWGAPVRLPNHAAEACLAALEAKAAEEPLRRQFRAEGFPEIYTRIGLNSGPVLVGNMGSSFKFNYTVMGDTVNLASRLEGANKNYGTYIMIGERTYELAKTAIEARELDLLTVKGKTLPTRVYQLVARKGELTAAQKEGFGLFEEALKLYRGRKFQEAEKRLADVLRLLPEDPPSLIYIERCRLLQAEPPADDWDGVWHLKEK